MPVPLNLTQLFTNNAISLLAAPIDSTATSLTVMAGHGAKYPQPVGDGSDFFFITLEDLSAAVREIIKVTGRTGDTLTFALADRAQEGTVALAWTANAGHDTLVDHRVTAETMRRAMQLPIGGNAGVTIQENAVTVGIPATVLNFTGPISVTGAGNTKQINITSTGGASDIHGSTTLAPIIIDPGWTQSASTVIYSNYQRGFKFFVTLYMPANHKSCTFEVLGNISGDISASTETVKWNRTSRIGSNFVGTTNVSLKTSTKELELTWQNGEMSPIEVMCTRIQHLP